LKPKKINSIVLEYFKETKYIEVKETLNINKVWENVVGKTIAKNTEVLNIKHGKIVIKTINPVWRNELIFQKEDLLQRLKKQEPKLKIKKIEFK
tara:strand:- start:130 stop:411 length:282 start_codon:yes stop_codon:yes gene_type:complete